MRIKYRVFHQRGKLMNKLWIIFILIYINLLYNGHYYVLQDICNSCGTSRKLRFFCPVEFLPKLRLFHLQELLLILNCNVLAFLSQIQRVRSLQMLYHVSNMDVKLFEFEFIVFLHCCSEIVNFTIFQIGPNFSFI